MIFDNTVLVTADTELFVFSRGSRSANLQPSLCLSLDSPPLILAVGESTTEQEHVFVHLFRKPLLPFNYTELLAAFLRHGISTISSSRWMIRARVKFIVSERLCDHAAGYYDGILRAAAMHAGAINHEAIIVQKEGNDQN